jgi:hypothetical protein
MDMKLQITASKAKKEATSACGYSENTTELQDCEAGSVYESSSLAKNRSAALHLSHSSV